MDNRCGQLVTLNGDTFPGTFFSLTSGYYKENLDCLLTIKASTINQRIIIVMDKMDVICGDKLLIYDGKKDPGLLLNNNESLQCGRNKYYFRVKFFFLLLIIDIWRVFFVDNTFEYDSS
jgi:hypothetical protein